jgi:hypothetical protein
MSFNQVERFAAGLRRRYRHGMVTIMPTGKRVAAPSPETPPTMKQSQEVGAFDNLTDNQRTIAQRRLLKRWTLM